MGVYAVDRMLADMTPQELMEWQAWYRIERPDRLDFYMQQLLSMTANIGFAKAKTKPGDFAPDLRTPAQRTAGNRVRMETAAEDERLAKWGAEVLEQQAGKKGLTCRPR